MNSIGNTLECLRKRWGEHDSDFLLSEEVRMMSPEERRERLERIADEYLQADSASERFIISAQRDAYLEGNVKLYGDDL